MKYRVRIGMEAHLQLRTQTKMFCRCPAVFGAEPNTFVCPVCLGLPGALPVPNREAIALALSMASAVGARIAETTWFDRKNYFYADLPKGYQISQFTRPLGEGGHLEIVTDEGVRAIALRRLHIEEDTSKSLHDDAEPVSRIDDNRAGRPLVEIVSEPELESASEARAYLYALRALVRYLDISDGSMEKGHLRCEPNVNLVIEEDGRTVTTPITEIKNLNSVRNVERAILSEVERQLDEYRRRGAAVENDPRTTCGFDVERDRTFIQRYKEGARDYRYFPEPDIPPIGIGAAWREEAEARVPELPHERRGRIAAAYGLTDYDAEILCRDRPKADFFEKSVRAGAPAKPAANWILGELSRHAKERRCGIEELGISASRLAGLIDLVETGAVGRGPAEKEILPRMLDDGPEARRLVEDLGLAMVEDEAQIENAAARAISAQAEAVAHYHAGKAKALDALIGAVMRETGGAANPRLVRDVLQRVLERSK